MQLSMYRKGKKFETIYCLFILCTATYHQIAKSTHRCGSPLCLRHQLLFFILLVLVVLDYIVILPHNPISLHNILIYHVSAYESEYKVPINQLSYTQTKVSHIEHKQ